MNVPLGSKQIQTAVVVEHIQKTKHEGLFDKTNNLLIININKAYDLSKSVWSKPNNHSRIRKTSAMPFPKVISSLILSPECVTCKGIETKDAFLTTEVFNQD